MRDHIAQVDVMLGQAVAQNQMHTRQIGGRQLLTGRKTTAKPAWQTHYCLLAVESIAVSVIAKEIVTSIDLTAAAEMIPQATMTANDAIERMSARSSTAVEVIREEALTSYLGETRSPAGDEEPIVTATVLEVQGSQRLVENQNSPHIQLQTTYRCTNLIIVSYGSASSDHSRSFDA